MLWLGMQCIHNSQSRARNVPHLWVWIGLNFVRVSILDHGAMRLIQSINQTKRSRDYDDDDGADGNARQEVALTVAVI